MNDPLVDKAIDLRDHLHKISQYTDKQQSLTLSEAMIMSSVEKACQACVEMGQYFLKQHNWKEEHNTYCLFQALVAQKIIEPALSKRLLSLISYGKLLRQAAHIKGKNCHIKLNKRQLEDMHTFTQNLLLA